MLIKCLRGLLLVFFVLLFIHPEAEGQKEDLISYFSQNSIPVFSIAENAQNVIVKLRYREIKDLVADKLESHQLSVLGKIAAEFPGSSSIRLEYYSEDQVILSNVYKTSDALDFSSGSRSPDKLLADGSLDISEGFSELFSQDQLISQGKGSSGVQTGQVTEQTASGKGFSPGQASYLGIQYLPGQRGGIRIGNILSDSPAQHAGLQIGDIVLAIEDKKIDSSDLKSTDVAEYVFSLPSDRPLRFRIERDFKQYDVYVKLTRMQKDLIIKLMDDEHTRLKGFIEQGARSLDRSDYEAAIQSFRLAQDMYPNQAFQGLGISYYNKRYYDDAFYYLARAYEHNPQSAMTIFYMSVNFDQWGKKQEAIFCFETYLRFQDMDQNRRNFAQRQLNILLERYKRNPNFPFKNIDEIINYILLDKK